MIPIRCFTCGKVIADKWLRYKSYLESGMKNDIALDNVGLTRYCCRRMFLGHVETIDQQILYSNDTYNDYDEKSEKSSDN
jgi:DNA-directed RNA polymerase subunit N (RpoN/RPB10)